MIAAIYARKSTEQLAPGDKLLTVSPPLELPRREAPDVDVELVEAGVAAIMSELDLELHLIALDRQVADRARGTDSWPPQMRSGLRFGSFPACGAPLTARWQMPEARTNIVP